MGSEEPRQIRRVDIQLVSVTHNTSRLAGIGVRDTEAVSFVVHKAVKRNAALGQSQILCNRQKRCK